MVWHRSTEVPVQTWLGIGVWAPYTRHAFPTRRGQTRQLSGRQREPGEHHSIVVHCGAVFAIFSYLGFNDMSDLGILFLY